MVNQQTQINFCEGIIPQTYVIPSDSTTTAQSGLGDRVAVIGAFPKVSPSLEYYTSFRSACSGLNISNSVNDIYREYTTKPTELLASQDYFPGAASLRYLFHAGTLDNTVSSVLVCNYTRYIMTTEGGDEIKCKDGEELLSINLSDDDVKSALEQLKNEEFDILLLAFAPTVKQIEMIIEWEREIYTTSNPVGVVFGTNEDQLKVINGSTQTAGVNTDSKKIQSVIDSVVAGSEAVSFDTNTVLKLLEPFAKAKKENQENHTLYACIPQAFKLSYEDKYLTPVESAAYYCGKIANLRVNKSMTNRQIEHVEAVNEDLTYTRTYVEGTTGDDLNGVKESDGYKLVAAGATMVRCTNRTNREFCVVNSQQPCGLDLAHLRTTAYIIKRLGLKPYLGKLNNITNIDLITSRLSTVKNTLIGMFDILDSIDYSVERASKNCVKIYLNLVYYGILLNEVIYVTEDVI